MAEEGLHATLTGLLTYIHQAPDTATRLRRCQELMDAIQHLERDIKEIRRQQMVSLHENDQRSFHDIAQMAGISKARVRQIVTEYEKPTRPGVIEQQIHLAAARSAGKNLNVAQQVADIYRQVKNIKGITGLSVHQWSQYSGLGIDEWRDFLA